MGPSEAELIGRVALATLLGALVGLERELSDKDAGVRTLALVALGASGFTIAGFAVLQLPNAGLIRPDPGRIAAQVASGIGFIGAGLIIFQGNKLRGLTTAAGVWAVAGIGVLAGFGYLIAASAVTGLMLLVILGGRILDRFIARTTKHRTPPRQTDARDDRD